MINDGAFTGLERISLIFSPDSQDRNESRRLAFPGLLPGLRHFGVFCQYGGSPFELPQAVFQSFLSAAPNLESLESEIDLDLSDVKLRSLKLRRVPSARETETKQMIHSVRERA